MNNAGSFSERPSILVVDSAPDNIALISGELKKEYRVETADSGEKALAIAGSASPPDLILLDIMMPSLNGYKICRELKKNDGTKHIPVIFLAPRSDEDIEKHGLSLGAEDYISRPLKLPLVMARVKTHINRKAAADFLRDKNKFLQNEIKNRTRDILKIEESIIFILASLAETRDSDTSNHLYRTQRYVSALAIRLQEHRRFRSELTDSNINLLFKSAPLHDIGKIGIPDHILLKAGPLDPAEFEIMKTHTTIGLDAIGKAQKSLGSNVGFLSIAKEIVHHHHEKWDGTGYPDSLSGENISVFSRLMALADVYDALACNRTYRKGKSQDEAYQIIIEGRGTHFDPDIVSAFEKLQKEFGEIAGQYADT
jgi:putative two-component system response regulator